MEQRHFNSLDTSKLAWELMCHFVLWLFTLSNISHAHQHTHELPIPQLFLHSPRRPPQPGFSVVLNLLKCVFIKRPPSVKCTLLPSYLWFLLSWVLHLTVQGLFFLSKIGKQIPVALLILNTVHSRITPVLHPVWLLYTHRCVCVCVCRGGACACKIHLLKEYNWLVVFSSKRTHCWRSSLKTFWPSSDDR